MSESERWWRGLLGTADLVISGLADEAVQGTRWADEAVDTGQGGRRVGKAADAGSAGSKADEAADTRHAGKAPTETPPKTNNQRAKAKTEKKVDPECCFLAGTLVRTSMGLRKIETIVSSEQVLARDPVTGEWQYAEVLETFVNEYSDDVVTIEVASDRIDCTGGHPFWVCAGEGLFDRPATIGLDPLVPGSILSGRWVQARHLQPGDLLATPEGTLAVDALSTRTESVLIYNLNVAEVHTYSVGNKSLWVHNTSGRKANDLDPCSSGLSGPGKNEPKSASEKLPQLEGKSEHEIRKTLEDSGYTQTKVSNSPGRNETWTHPDGSEVRIHPYGNQKRAPYKSANNAHVHKQDPHGNQLNDRGIPSNNPSDTHIGMPNPPDLPTVRGRPHGAGSL